MFVFEVYVKKDSGWSSIDGTPVFPYGWAEMLDERLDEADITLYNSKTPEFERTSEVEIKVYENAKWKFSQYYIIASDHAVKYPLWDDTYKHQIHLIERTKLLEGIICPSLTFTNALKRSFATNAPAVAKDLNENLSKLKVSSFFTSSIKQNYDANTKNAIPFYGIREEVCEAIKNALGEKSVDHYYTGSPDPKLTVIIGSTVTTYTDKLLESVEFIIPNEGCYVQYDFRVKLTGNDYSTGYYDISIAFTLEAIIEHLPPKRITITDVVNRVLRCAEPLISPRIEPRYTFNDEQAKKYENVFAPEFTLTQNTLREQLKTVGAFIHAEPWIDENDFVYFKEYALSEACPLEEKPYIYDGAQSDINEYNTSLLSNAQNLVSTAGNKIGAVSYPSDSFSIAPRSEMVYARLEEGNAKVITREKIHSIIKVWCNDNDITSYVFESVEYSNNLSSFDSGYPYSKSWAIFYTAGTNVIDGIFYTPPEVVATQKTYSISNILAAITGNPVSDIQRAIEQDPASISFRIEYIPVGSATVTHGKQKFVKGQTPFAKIYNQGENEVESQWYGENLKGVAARLGNINVERTYILSSLDYLPEIGQKLDGYVITATRFELMPYYLKCTVSLTRDFNRLSEYIGVSSVKRMYEISERQIARRDIHIHRTLVLGNAEDAAGAQGDEIFSVLCANDIFQSSGEGLGRLLDSALLTSVDGKGNEIATVLLPVQKYAIGNSCVFSFGFKDNYSAGDKLILKNTSDGETGFVKGYWGSDVPYADYYGKVRSMWIRLLTLKEMENKFKYDGFSKDELKLLAPECSFSSTKTPLIHTVDKDSREALSYTIELEAKTTFDNVIIGSGLARLCTYVSGKSRLSSYEPPRVYLAKTPIDRFASVIDTTDSDLYIDAGEITPVLNADSKYMGLKFNSNNFSLPTSEYGTFYGLVIATPTTSEEVSVHYNGKDVIQTVYSGGDVVFQIEEEITHGFLNALSHGYIIGKKLQSIYFYIESE